MLLFHHFINTTNPPNRVNHFPQIQQGNQYFFLDVYIQGTTQPKNRYFDRSLPPMASSFAATTFVAALGAPPSKNLSL
jgi:hypothetical protein